MAAYPAPPDPPRKQAIAHAVGFLYMMPLMTISTDLERCDGLGLAELVRRKEVTAEEVLEATLSRIETRNPAINAVVTRMDDQARALIGAGLPAGAFTRARSLS